MPRKCGVPGCRKKKVIVHSFPKYEKVVFDIWKQRVGHPRFTELDDKIIYRSYAVCHDHFIDDCKLPGTKRLKMYSLPTIDVPGFKGEPNIINSYAFPYPREHKQEFDVYGQSEIVNFDHDYTNVSGKLSPSYDVNFTQNLEIISSNDLRIEDKNTVNVLTLRTPTITSLRKENLQKTTNEKQDTINLVTYEVPPFGADAGRKITQEDCSKVIEEENNSKILVHTPTLVNLKAKSSTKENIPSKLVHIKKQTTINILKKTASTVEDVLHCTETNISNKLITKPVHSIVDTNCTSDIDPNKRISKEKGSDEFVIFEMPRVKEIGKTNIIKENNCVAALNNENFAYFQTSTFIDTGARNSIKEILHSKNEIIVKAPKEISTIVSSNMQKKKLHITNQKSHNLSKNPISVLKINILEKLPSEKHFDTQNVASNVNKKKQIRMKYTGKEGYCKVPQLTLTRPTVMSYVPHKCRKK